MLGRSLVLLSHFCGAGWRKASANFGYSVALEADTVVAGAFKDDGGDVTNAGAVYISEGIKSQIVSLKCST